MTTHDNFELPPLGKLIVLTGSLPKAIDLGELGIKMHFSPRVIAVKPPGEKEHWLGTLLGLIRPKKLMIRVFGVTHHLRLKTLSDPRRVAKSRGYQEAAVVIFADSHGWTDHRKLQEACDRVVLEGKSVVILGDRHIGETVASIMAISDDPQILTQPCLHVDENGLICGELTSRQEPRCRKHSLDPREKSETPGSIILVIGPPGAGKTAHAKLRYQQAQKEGKAPLLVTTRGKLSRAGHEFHLEEAVRAETYGDLLRQLEDHHRLVIIDEGTLMTNLGQNIRQLADSRGLEVIIYGRPTDARGEAEMPHRETVHLMMAADEVVAWPAICEVCGRKAMRSQYLLEEEPTRFFDTFRLRGTKRGKKLQTRCRRCHIVRSIPKEFEPEEEDRGFSEIVQDAWERINLRHPTSLIFSFSVILLSGLIALIRRRRRRG